MGLTPEKVDKLVDVIWTVLNFLYIFGGIIGALLSKYILHLFGRRNGLIYNNLFTVAGFIFTIISTYVKSPECILVGRFLFGIQAGINNCFLR
jgi:MFS family permease